jgi:hypothetical protein
MKYILIAVLAAVALSLAWGLYLRSKDNRDSPASLPALWLRVNLSALLILFLVPAYFMD